MPHRRRGPSATALLTALLLMTLSAPAWAQGGAGGTAGPCPLAIAGAGFGAFVLVSLGVVMIRRAG